MMTFSIFIYLTNYYLTELIGSFQNCCLELDIVDVSVNSVADAEQFVRVEDDEL